jgi:hypothetical protein
MKIRVKAVKTSYMYADVELPPEYCNEYYINDSFAISDWVDDNLNNFTFKEYPQEVKLDSWRDV